MRWITLAIAVVAVIVRASACTSVCDKHVVERLRHLDEGMKELAGDFFGLFAPSLMFPFEASSSLFWERVTESLLSKETAHLYFFGGSMVLGTRCKEGGIRKRGQEEGKRKEEPVGEGEKEGGGFEWRACTACV